MASVLPQLSDNMNDVEVDDPPIIQPEVVISADEPSLQRLPLRTGSKLTSTHDIASRIMRYKQLAVQDKELHSMRVSLLRKKDNFLVRQILHEVELFKMKKKIQNLKKRKLMLEIQKLGGE